MKMRTKRPKRIWVIWVGFGVIVSLSFAELLIFTVKSKAQVVEKVEAIGAKRRVLLNNTPLVKTAMKMPPAKSPKKKLMSSVQAKIRARDKLQKEVRELERALAKLLRENPITPDESNANFRNELYARKVGGIISQAGDGVTPHNVNGSRLRLKGKKDEDGRGRKRFGGEEVDEDERYTLHDGFVDDNDDLIEGGGNVTHVSKVPSGIYNSDDAAGDKKSSRSPKFEMNLENSAGEREANSSRADVSSAFLVNQSAEGLSFSPEESQVVERLLEEEDLWRWQNESGLRLCPKIPPVLCEYLDSSELTLRKIAI